MLSSIGSRKSLPSKTENKEREDKGEEKNPYSDLTKWTNASLNLFDTPNAWAIGLSKNNKPLLRALISIVVLNLLPGLFFAIFFVKMNSIQTNINIPQILAIVWIALMPQWIYRFFYALLTFRDGKWIYINDKHVESNFNDFDLAALAILWEDRFKFKAHKEPYYHLAFPLFFYLPSVLLIFLFLFGSEVDQNISYILKSLSIILIAGGGLLFCLERKKK